MILKNITFNEFGNYVKINNKKIILFGAGTLVKSWIPYELEYLGITNRIKLIADNLSDKWGKIIVINGVEFVIENAEMISKNVSEDTVILITSSYFAAMIEQLDRIDELDNTECYVAPIMHITDKKNGYKDISRYMEKEQHIPKVIHYCWFGNNPMPERNKQCIESWMKYCPDYEIVEWNENNYDIGKNRYMKQAYEAGKYGYVPDYARIDILYNYGGIYLDTDVELIKNLDDLLYLKAYAGFEEYPTVNFGGGSGSERGLSILKSILDFRDNIDFIEPGGSYNLTTCGYYESVPLVKEGLRLDGSLQNVKGLTIMPSEYFHPKSSVTGLTETTCNTYSIHQFSWSWTEEKQRNEKMKTHRKYQEILRRMREN